MGIKNKVLIIRLKNESLLKWKKIVLNETEIDVPKCLEKENLLELIEEITITIDDKTQTYMKVPL